MSNADAAAIGALDFLLVAFLEQAVAAALFTHHVGAGLHGFDGPSLSYIV